MSRSEADSDDNLEFESADEGSDEEETTTTIPVASAKQSEIAKSSTEAAEVEKRHEEVVSGNKISSDDAGKKPEATKKKTESDTSKESNAKSTIGAQETSKNKLAAKTQKPATVSSVSEAYDDINKLLNEMGFGDNKPDKEKPNKQQEAPKQEKPTASGWDTWDESKANESDKARTTSKPSEQQVPPLKQELEKPKPAVSGWDTWDDAEFNADEDGQETEDTNLEKKQHANQQTQQEAPPQQPRPLPSSKSNSGSGGWGSSWNFVSSLTSQLGDGLNKVLETVETTIGAPDPAELATKIKNEQHEKKSTGGDENEKKPQPMLKSSSNKSNQGGGWIEENDTNQQEWFSMPSPLAKLTSMQKITGTIGNVLETVGKKTIEVINDKDPNLKQTREFLKTKIAASQKPNLSQLLREAQEKKKTSEEDESWEALNADATSKGSPKAASRRPAEKPTFAVYFEEYKGVAHQEAFEMLSRQISVRIEMSMNKAPLKAIFEQLDDIFDERKLNDDDDDDDKDEDASYRNDCKLLRNQKSKQFDVDHFEFLLNDYGVRFNLKLPTDKVIAAFRSCSHASKELTLPDDLFNESIKCFALITSKLVEFYHKTGEALLIESQNEPKQQNKRASKVLSNNSNIIQRAENLLRITRLCIQSIDILAEDLSKKCRELAKASGGKTANINQIMTDIYLEASNSSTYIGDAFLLLAPIFKLQAIESLDKEKEVKA